VSRAPQVLGVEEWHAFNARYLGLALEWLRLRLAAAAGDPLDMEIAAAAESLADAQRSSPPPALVLLADAFELSSFERDVVLLCAAMTLDTRTGALCARAHQDAHLRYPTFALAMSVFDEPDWAAIAPTGALRSERLVEDEATPGEPLTLRALSTDERIVHFLKGLNVVDERLARLLRPVWSPSGALPPSQAATAESITLSLDHLSGRLVQLVGANETSKRSVVAEVAVRRRLLAYELPVASLPTSPLEADDLSRLWRRESRLLPIALLLTSDRQALPAAQARSVRSLVDGQEAPVLLSVADVCADLADLSTVHDVRTPTAAEQRGLWTEALGGQTDVAGRLAAEFDFDGSEIQRVADDAKRVGDGDLAEGAWVRGKSLSRPHLDALAERIRPVATWDDIVVSGESTHLLHCLADQARNRGQVYDAWGWRDATSRGLGISALFTGESGTGKTMAAEVLANDLGLDLYRIDLSGVVSKYIGETEKNLRRLFDAAELGGVVLFFDEADALFGKRSEVKDSHDRYANIEVNYLLQRMESYRGLAILATNLRSALDPAFTRRLRFIVPFALPSRPERERIWQRAFPPTVPVDGVDPGRLARLNLNGALIHSVALHASFSAAAAGTSVTMDLILDAVRVELRKAERSTNEVEAI
jgi:hypothetical protein